MMEGNVLELLEERFQGMSKNQKIIASFVMDHFDRAAFMTAARLARELGISESTVVRFAASLGFSGYQEFQNGLAICVRDRLSGEEKGLEAYYGRSRSEILTSVMNADAQRILKTMENVDASSFEMAVDLILKSEYAYVCGFSKNEPLAMVLASYLRLARRNVILITKGDEDEVREQLLYAGEKDCLIAFQCAGESKKTMKAVELMNGKGAKAVIFTDEPVIPSEEGGVLTLIAGSEKLSVVDSLTAPLSLVNALIVALVLKRPGEVKANVKALEEAQKEHE